MKPSPSLYYKACKTQQTPCSPNLFPLGEPYNIKEPFNNLPLLINKALTS